jgi:LAS superfamily LD-carboxypeptidase LdcB
VRLHALRLHALRPSARAQHARRPSRRPLAEALVAVTASSVGLVGVLHGTGAASPATAPAGYEVSTVADADGTTLTSTRTPARASRDRRAVPARPAPDPLPGCPKSVLTTHGNGQLPAEALCALPGNPDHELRPDAARAFVRLTQAFEEHFGSELCFTDSYRSLGSQQALAQRKPGLAAVPGTSEHGWGLAIDFGCGVEGYETPQHRWMKENAGRFGWGQPEWAKDGGAREEPWHWEYLAGQPAGGRATGR